MGLVFFLIPMAILLLIAVMLFTVSLITLLVWFVFRRKGKKLKKRWLTIPSILLIISFVFAVIPIGYIGFIRFTNADVNEPVNYVKTDVMLHWGDINKSWFIMDGEMYVTEKNPSNSNYGLENLGEPVANIKQNPQYKNSFNEFMTWVGSGKTAEEIYMCTIYPVDEDGSLEFLYVTGRGFNRIFRLEN